MLYFDRPLEEIEPKSARTGHGTTTTSYSWSDGVVRIAANGSPTSGPTAAVREPSARGDSALHLDDPPFDVGDDVFIESRDRDGSLANYLYRGDVRDSDTDLGDRIRCRQIATVIAVDGAVVTLDRPLRFDVRPEWTTVRRFAPAVVESGIEHLTIEFPSVPYRGHFEEDGYNGIALGNAADCWVDDVEIVNGDSGIFVSGHRITLRDVVLRNDRQADARGHTGHHGLDFSGTECLATGFDLQARFIHDLGVAGGAVGNVYANGRGDDLSMDHHRWAPYENLYSNLDLGAGTRSFASGGTQTRGRHTAAGATFWNLRAERPAKMPNADFGPPTDVFFVGVQGLRPGDGRDGWYVEERDPSDPDDLHAHQLAERHAASSPRTERPSP